MTASAVVARHPTRRFVAYSIVSAMAFILAQLGLAIGYGVLRWAVAPAVLLSLAISVVPAYLLLRWFVWPASDISHASVGEAGMFFAIALGGSLATAVVVSAAELIARAITVDHLTLSVVVNASSVLATLVIWVLRYLVLDRLLFADRTVRAGEPALSPGPP